MRRTASGPRKSGVKTLRPRASPGVEGAALAGSADFDAYGLTMDFGDTAIQQCVGCHSRREAYGDGNPLPGTPYHDAYNLSLLRPGLDHADGQILDEV